MRRQSLVPRPWKMVTSNLLLFVLAVFLEILSGQWHCGREKTFPRTLG
jgi:hypothetical protein